MRSRAANSARPPESGSSSASPSRRPYAATRGPLAVLPLRGAMKSLAAVLSWQKADGFFGTAPQDPDPSWATAPALLALVAHGQAAGAERAAHWLVRWRTPQDPPTEEQRKRAETLLRIDLT